MHWNFQPARVQDLFHVPHGHFQEGNDLVRPHVRKEDDPRGPPQVQLPVEVPERLARAAGQGNILAGQGVLRDSYLEAFFRKGIPTIYFHSEGSYTHLHLASDTADTLNPRLLEGVARLASGLAREIADGGYAREPIAPPVAPRHAARD